MTELSQSRCTHPSPGALTPLCLALPKGLFYCLLFVVSNATFHFKQGASGDDHSVSHDFKLSTAWVTHPLQDVAGTHPPARDTAGRPACLPKLEGNLDATRVRLGMVPGRVEAAGLAGSPPEGGWLSHTSPLCIFRLC